MPVEDALHFVVCFPATFQGNPTAVMGRIHQEDSHEY